MAIAFDNASTSFTYTCTGSNLILFVVITQQGNINSGIGASYNGVSMTSLGNQLYTNGCVTVFYLLNPSTGTHAVTLSNATADSTGGVVSSYTGVRQDSQPDHTTQAVNDTGSTGVTASNTSVADNCWTILGIGVQSDGVHNTNLAASTGATSRAISDSHAIGVGLFDSNSAKTPAGSVSEAVTFTGAGSSRYAYTILSISPHTSTARYWVGGTGTWDSSTVTHWSLTSGGSGGAEVPTADNAVIFDSNSGGGTVTTSGTVTGLSLTCTGYTGTISHAGTMTIVNDITFGSAMTFSVGGALTIGGNITFGSAMTFSGSSSMSIFGNTTFTSGMTLTYSGTITFNSTVTGKTIATAGKTLLSPIVFNGVGGGWTLQDSFIITGTSITLTNGSLNLGNQNVSTPIFLSSNSNTRTLTMGSGTISLTGTGTVWDTSTTTSLTFTPNTSTINLTNSSSSSKTFAGGSLTYYNLTMTSGNSGTYTLSGTNTFNNFYFTGSGTGLLTISGSNTYNDFKIDTPPHTVNFGAGKTQTFATFTVSGTAGNLMTLQSTSSGTAWYLVKSVAGTNVVCDYLSLQDSHISTI